MVKADFFRSPPRTGLAAAVGDYRAEQRDPVNLLGALDVSRGDVAGINHVLRRHQGCLGQVIVDPLGEPAILHRGDRGGDVHHDLGPLLLAGFGVVHAIAAPLGSVLGAAVRVGVVGRVEAPTGAAVSTR